MTESSLGMKETRSPEQIVADGDGPGTIALLLARVVKLEVSLAERAVLTRREVFSRGKLQEEMGELGEVLGKQQAFPKGPHPSRSVGENLRSKLSDELTDVEAAIAFYRETYDIPIDQPRFFGKLQLYKGWMEEDERDEG